MTNRCFIKDLTTGEVREFTHEDPEMFDDDYIWADGNFACDCNRSRFFNRAGGSDDEGRIECSDDLFAINIRRPDGSFLVEEFEPCRQHLI